MRKRMFLLTRSLMQLRRDMGHSPESNIIEVMVGNNCNDGYVARIISIWIARHIRVVGLKSAVIMGCRQLGMLDRAFLRSMQHWITGRRITRQLLLRWKVRYMIKLFLF